MSQKSIFQKIVPTFLLRLGRHLYPDGSLRNIVTLSSGSMLGQLILLATAPVISRLYSPDDFGLFAIFFSIFGIVSILSTLQYQNAIPIPSRDRDGARLLIASLVILILFIILFLGALGVFYKDIARLTNIGEEHRILWYLPVAIGAANANLCLQFWFLRKKEYMNLAMVKGVQSITMAGGQVMLGLANFGAIGLIVGHIAGQVIGMAYLAKGVSSRYLDAFSDIRLSSVFDTAIQNKSFATTFTPSALLSASAIYLPALIFGMLFGPSVAGIFAFTLQLSRAGINIIVQAVSKVFLVSSIEDFNIGNYDNLKRRAVRVSISQCVIGTPIFLTLVMFGESIFGFVLGDKWAIGGLYVALLTPHLMTLFIFDHLASLFLVTGSHRAKLLWDALKFLVLIVTFTTSGIFNWSPEITVLVLACSWGILHILLIPITFWCLREARGSAQGP